MASTLLKSRLKLALKTAGGVAAAALVAFTLPLANERVAQQDERSAWTALASAYEAFDADAPIAALTLIDAADGVSVAARGIEDLQTFDSDHLQSARFSERERRCLAEGVFYEARSETVWGQKAVAEVILNRVRHRAYPNTICEVVYQGSERVTGCQFTFTCDGSMERAPYGRGWERAQMVADHAMMGFAQPVTRRATHYHTTAVDPHWNDSLVRTRRIGEHIFYRFPNRSERQLLMLEREA
ncbi:MAG: cell wall hydrolase [Pseudomonadota bacterium]